MQKGKMYRGGVERTTMILALAFTLIRGECMASDSWQRGMGGVTFPGRDHPASSGPGGGYLFASVSAANPFSIPGFYESTASISLIGVWYSAGMTWERAGITGFSRDRLELSGGTALPGGFLHLTLAVRADSRNVRGYGRETNFLPALSLSLELSPIAVIEIEGSGGPAAEPVLATIRVGRRMSCLVLTCERDGCGGRSTKMGGSIGISGGMSFLGGYNMETGEGSGGLALRGPVPAAFSWSVHPVLGSTFSVSVGAVR